ATAKAQVQIVSPVDDIEIVDVAADAAPAPESTAVHQSAQPVAQILSAAPPVVADQTPPAPGKPSLGQALLDNGVVQNTDNGPAPLAPFRRMPPARESAFFPV